MFNNRQRKNILFSIGIVILIGILGFLIWNSINSSLVGIPPEEIGDTIIQGIITYGGVLFLILKFITLFFTTKRTLTKNKTHTVAPVAPISETYVFNFESEKAFLKQTETALINEIKTELNKKIFAELRIENIKKLCLKNNCRVSKNVLEIIKKNVMIENKINEIKKIIG